MIIKIINAVLAILAGVGGAMVLYFVLNFVAERLPGKWEHRVKPYVFVGPAILVIGLFLLYPAIRTLIFSFANRDSTAFVGFSNYTEQLADPQFRQTLFNTLLWIIIVPALVVVMGLVVAVLADRLGARSEKAAKSIIFLPMAISLVGAATIWGFVYNSRPAGSTQIGLLNAVFVQLGFDPVAWLQIDTGRLNSLLLMIIMIWTQAGFAMVLLSAAIKSVPEDTLEAARIDGATEVQAFFRIIVPQIWATVITVFITVLIGVMKIFDIIYVSTNGNFNTNVIGVEFFNQIFTNLNFGYASAIVIMLMIAIIPVMVYQVRHFKKQEANA